MAVFRIIPAGDLKLEGGDVVVLGSTTSTRIQYIRQKIASRFKFFLGEWFLDKRKGIPYYRDAFIKRPNQRVLRSLFLRVLRTTPGVTGVPSFSLHLDPETRQLSFAFQAVVDGSADLVVRQSDQDFVLGVARAT